MNVRLRASAILGICVLTSLLGSCCDRKTRRAQSHWLRVFENMELASSNLERRSPGSSSAERLKISVGTTTKGDPFEAEAISGSIVAQHYGFWLDLTNKSRKPLRLLWPEARYIDELGGKHELFRQPMNPLPNPEAMKPSAAVMVPPGVRINDVIAPVYKSYMVAFGCREYTPYREPLVPTRLDDKNEEQMKAYVDNLAKRQVPVKLLLPIEIDGVRYDYTFTFVLKPRWADLPKE